MSSIHKALLVLLPLLVWSAPLAAQDPQLFDGYWVFNEGASDSTDKAVEKALKAMGQKVNSRWFSRDKERYRGGPADQELYDRISYDRVLTIEYRDDTYFFGYADDYQRAVYTDNRSRSVSLTGLDTLEDFSLAHWEGETLVVEARPRDGGFAEESYTLINAGKQLQAEFYILPRTFTSPVEVTRVFDRSP
ncbi:MAG TPA: hypothetical protein GX696_02065 [Pseudomonadaceae bacterium]|nr:hypothetical protein [Pseudomonadaceae bacterium]